MDQSTEKMLMEVVNPHAAGIDIGSRSHWVSVGPKEKDIREFGVFNEDLKALSNWLSENKITTVAMESTGTYWQALYAVLLADGFEVIDMLEIVGRDDAGVVIGAELLCDAARVTGLVECGDVEADRAGLDRRGAGFGHKRDDAGTVYAA